MIWVSNDKRSLEIESVKKLFFEGLLFSGNKIRSWHNPHLVFTVLNWIDLLLQNLNSSVSCGCSLDITEVFFFIMSGWGTDMSSSNSPNAYKICSLLRIFSSLSDRSSKSLGCPVRMMGEINFCWWVFIV